MKFSDIPVKIETAFAEDTSSTYRAVIPQSGAAPGRATWVAGFPPENFEPVGSGGIPPWGADMNGVLFATSVWLKWINAGGPLEYDGTFASEIGGYPAGAALWSTAGLGWWVSIADDNSNDPDALGANWLLVPVDQVFNGNPNGHLAGFSPGTGTSLRPASLAWDNANSIFWWCSQTGSTSTAQWVPLTTLTPVGSVLTGASRNYTAGDNDKIRLRSNSGSAMGDGLPGASGVADGWHTTIVNIDASATLTLTAPSGTSLNGVSTGTLAILAGQTAAIVSNGAGVYWMYIVPYSPQTAAGSEGQVQFNHLGVLAASANLAFDTGTDTLASINISATNIISALHFQGGNYTGAWSGDPIPVGKGGTGLTAMPFLPGTNGHVVYPPGILDQWGQALNIASGDTVTVSFSLTYSAVYNVGLTPLTAFSGSGISGDYAAFSYTANNFQLFNGMPATVSFAWRSIGVP